MEFVLPVLIAAVLAITGTAVVRSVARRFGLVVPPRHDRWHNRPTALYGGIAIALAAFGALGIFRWDALLGHPPGLAVTGGAAFMFLVGLTDDARGLGPVTKLIFQLGAATLLVLVGTTLPVTPFNPVNGLVTLFWFVGIVNALNLLDNMDGVTAGVSTVAALGLGVLFLGASDPLLATVAFTVAAASGGFLVFNFKPASIFMGDTGSLFLGACLAGLGAAYAAGSGHTGLLALLVPALVLLVPILDTTLVTITRTIHNRRISVGGRDHSTHRLVAMGFSEAGAALFLYGVGALALLVAWLAGSTRSAAGVWVGLLFLTGAMVFTGYLGRLHTYDDSPAEERRRRGVIIRNILLKRRGLELLLDVVLFGAAWYGAFVLYHDWGMPREVGALANTTLGVAIVVKLVAFHYFDVYRAVWHRPGLADVHRILKASLLAGVLVFATMALWARDPGVPGTIFVLDVLLTGSLAMAARTSFASLDRFRRRLRVDRGEPVVIEGAGPEVELALRVLELDPAAGFRVVGFVDDSAPAGTLIHGLPVLGRSQDLAQVLSSSHVRYLILTPGRADRERVRVARETCRAADVTLLTLQVGFEAIVDEPGTRTTSAPVVRFARVLGAG
jgi:UDP-GlcNAc:undecaprenyl-phosphate/decaprenyl-phosphate GlcNAc-1-phosphate transferase